VLQIYLDFKDYADVKLDLLIIERKPRKRMLPSKRKHTDQNDGDQNSFVSTTSKPVPPLPENSITLSQVSKALDDDDANTNSTMVRIFKILLSVPFCPCKTNIFVCKHSFIKKQITEQDSLGPTNPSPVPDGSGVDMKLLSLVEPHGEKRLNSLKFISQKKLKENVSSFLKITTPNYTYILELSPIEYYLADELFEYFHERETAAGGQAPKSDGVVKLLINSSTIQWFDPHGVVHVVRPGSEIFTKFKDLLQISPPDIIRILVKYGNADVSRTPGGVRLNIGCGGRCWNRDGVPANLIGLNFGSEDEEEKQSFLHQIGVLVKFLWNCMTEMQSQAKQPRMATDKDQKRFAQKLCDLLYIQNVDAEDVTISLMMLFPVWMVTKGHFDKMNDRLRAYSKTGTLNIVLEDCEGNIYLLQVSSRTKTK
jgi:hypothetical protein